MNRTKQGICAVLVLVLAVTLLGVSALAAPAATEQQISGAVNASALKNGASLLLTGDTVLTLDTSRNVEHIEAGPGAPKLTIRGSGTLTVTGGAVLGSLTLESGTLSVSGGKAAQKGALHADTLTVADGTLQCIAAAGSMNAGVYAETVTVSGGSITANDGGLGYGLEITGVMTVTGGSVSGRGHYSGVNACQLLVSAGSVVGTGTASGTEFDSCDGVFTRVLKLSGGFVSGKGTAAGITAKQRIVLTEGTGVVKPAGGGVPSEPVRIEAWGSDSDPYLTYTVLDSQNAIVTDAALGVPTPAFTDVPSAQYYAVPVAWANGMGITTGTSSTTFSPNATCTRGQVVTFLWRAAGEPAPRAEANGFVDVAPSDYYYKAVLWAVQNGITNGTDAAHFSPGATCTRGHVVTFLYRFEHSPAVTGANPFTDVRASDYFYSPVLWAVSRGITNGVSQTEFAPAAGCTRGQVVTFLYRDLHKTPTPDVLTD